MVWSLSLGDWRPPEVDTTWKEWKMKNNYHIKLAFGTKPHWINAFKVLRVFTRRYRTCRLAPSRLFMLVLRATKSRGDNLSRLHYSNLICISLAGNYSHDVWCHEAVWCWAFITYVCKFTYSLDFHTHSKLVTLWVNCINYRPVHP